MDSERVKAQIRKNATEIVRLNSRIRETVRDRDESPKKRLEWKEACAEFHNRYSNLAFPGGYDGALLRGKMVYDHRAANKNAKAQWLRFARPAPLYLLP